MDDALRGISLEASLTVASLEKSIGWFTVTSTASA
jgi:hypothetical protein